MLKKLQFTDDTDVHLERLDYRGSNINICSRPIKGNISLTVEGKTYNYSTPADTIRYSNAFHFNLAKSDLGIAVNENAKGYLFVSFLDAKPGTHPLYTLSFSNSKNWYFLNAPGFAGSAKDIKRRKLLGKKLIGAGGIMVNV